jgi:hypothetical protein
VPAPQPTHPRMKAAILMVGIVLVVILLALLSTFGSP